MICCKTGLEWELDFLKSRLHALEVKVDKLMEDSVNFDDRVNNAIEGKTHVMVVENLEAYKKGKKIKKEIDHISEVLRGEDE